MLFLLDRARRDREKAARKKKLSAAEQPRIPIPQHNVRRTSSLPKLNIGNVDESKGSIEEGNVAVKHGSFGERLNSPTRDLKDPLYVEMTNHGEMIIRKGPQPKPQTLPDDNRHQKAQRTDYYKYNALQKHKAFSTTNLLHHFCYHKTKHREAIDKDRAVSVESSDNHIT